MLSRILKIFILLMLLFFTVISCLLFEYRYTQNKNYKFINSCKVQTDNPDNLCYEKAYELLTPKLLVYKVKYKGQDVNFKVFPPSYVIPYEIASDTDTMTGYGVLDDMFAEEMYSSLFNKPSYGFDCGVDFKVKNPLVHFQKSCIVTDKYILNDEVHYKGSQRVEYHLVSSGDTHTFKQKIKELNLENKKLFVKADIGEAIFKALPDIINSGQNVDVISFALPYSSLREILKVLDIMDMMEKDYILIARAEHAFRLPKTPKNSKYIKNPVSDIAVLTFVNKRIIDKKELPWSQTSSTTYKNNFKPTTISKIVVLNQKIKNLIQNMKNPYRISNQTYVHN